MAQQSSAQPEPAGAFQERMTGALPALEARLHMPPVDQIYQINDEAMSHRPRLYFGDKSLAEIRRRFNDPYFALVKEQSDFILDRWTKRQPPQVSQMKGKDNRDYGDLLAPLALRVLLETDPAQREVKLQTVLKWTRAHQTWPAEDRDDLSAAQSAIGLATVYDWLFDILSDADRRQVRETLIGEVRVLVDDNRGDMSRWRGQSFVFNHNWIDHAGLAMAAMALWGDESAPLKHGELKSWLDEAMIDYWIVDQSHPTDGSPTEGVTYQDYGLRAYVDTIMNAERLLKVKTTFFDERLHAMANRVQLALPDNSGFMVYADSHPSAWFNNAPWFDALAAKYNDDRFTLISNICTRIGVETNPQYPRGGPRIGFYSWRSLFYTDPSRKPSKESNEPTHFDFADFGLYTVRRDWSANSSFFGLRCGSLGGTSVAERFGSDQSNGHLYPNQGAFSFYSGRDAIIPGRPYPHLKVTEDHSLAVFEGRDADAGKLAGQVGGGAQWFYVRPGQQALRAAAVVKVEHTDAYHSYLCDLGGVYRLADNRVPGQVFFPSYWRSLVYLPTGAVVIVDRIQTEVPRTVHFILPTTATDLAVSGKDFVGTVSGKAVRIRDVSPKLWERRVDKAIIKDSTGDSYPRGTATLTAAEQTTAVFAVIIDVNNAASSLEIQTDDRGYQLIGLPSGPMRVNWPANP